MARKFSFPPSSSRNTIVSLSSRMKKKNFISSRNLPPLYPGPKEHHRDICRVRRKQVSLSEVAAESGPVGIVFGTDFRKTYVERGRKKYPSFGIFLVVSSSLLRGGKYGTRCICIFLLIFYLYFELCLHFTSFVKRVKKN